MEKYVLEPKNIVYYARAIPTCQIYEVIQLKIRTVNDSMKFFVGVDKDSKHAFLFNFSDLGECVFTDREDALNFVNIAESKNESSSISNKEKYYEEY